MRMRIVNSVKLMQRRALEWRRRGRAVGFVPTMGYLHAGHLSLVRRARQAVGPSGIVVVSIYVNPTQFAPHEDLSKYPRDFAADRRLCEEAGVDVLFFPSDDQMYPGRNSGEYSTYVTEESLSRGLEGGSRPTHFRGVTTVVAKLFNLVLPTVAVFGAKDFQQAAVVRRMVQDLHLPVRMVVAPTTRERDGLALSSRNKYLNAEQRRQAVALWEAMQTARRVVRQSRGPAGLPARGLSERLRRQIEKNPDARVDYIAFFNPKTLVPVARVRSGNHLALAVFVGSTRLIDNARLD